MKVYIAGKITGDEAYKEKFAKYARYEEELGNIVLNPATLPAGLSQADYMRICLAMLDCSDEARFIPDFIGSVGARVERDYCEKIGKPWSVYGGGLLA